MVRDGPTVPEAVWIQLTAALSYRLVGGHRMDQKLTFISSFIHSFIHSWVHKGIFSLPYIHQLSLKQLAKTGEVRHGYLKSGKNSGNKGEELYLGSHPSSQLVLEPSAKDLDSCLSPKVLPVEYLVPQLG